jgi:hypothetical protein
MILSELGLMSPERVADVLKWAGKIVLETMSSCGSYGAAPLRVTVFLIVCISRLSIKYPSNKRRALHLHAAEFRNRALP